MPIDYRDYPANWGEIRKAILLRAGDKCEWCHVPNKATGARDRFGEWHDSEMIEGMNSDVGYHLFGDDYPAYVRIILTIAHLDHDRTHNDHGNLAALCQRCHLNHDRVNHIRNRRINRIRRKIQEGQYALLEV